MFEFSKVARMLLIFGHRHSKINVNIKQQFYYDPNGDKVQFNIILTVECKESIEDIEGLIEIMEGEVLTLGTGMYKKSKGK
ncbi:hypothetical protein D3C71_1219700 [compost metagenome]